jgi:ABC-type Fe3+ transport system permease subunit
MVVLLWALGLLAGAVVYVAVVPVMYHAMVAILLDEEADDWDEIVWWARIGAVIWPGVVLGIAGAAVWDLFAAGIAGFREAWQEAQERRRPWRKRGNVVTPHKWKGLR